MNLTMIGALGKMTEWELHCRGAIGNGVTKEELRAIIHIIGIYCGVPQALECMRAARRFWTNRNKPFKAAQHPPISPCITSVCLKMTKPLTRVKRTKLMFWEDKT